MGALVVIPGMASETKTKFYKNSLVAIAIAKTYLKCWLPVMNTALSKAFNFKCTALYSNFNWVCSNLYEVLIQSFNPFFLEIICHHFFNFLKNFQEPFKWLKKNFSNLIWFHSKIFSSMGCSYSFPLTLPP